jgi:FkbM family methyltransferase
VGSQTPWPPVAAPRLPAPLRAWSVIGRALPYRARRSGALALSQRLLESHRLYSTPDGYLFGIDSADAFQALMVTGLYDSEVTRVACGYARPGTVVIDGGAQLGYLTLRLARAVGAAGQVHAFEPDPRAVPMLREHVVSNQLPWVTVNESGLLDRACSVDLALPAVLGWASVIPGAWNAEATARVPMTTLDVYVSEHRIEPEEISLIKLDLEGAELDALRGARGTLSATHSAVLVEYLPERMRQVGQDPQELFRLMHSCGFSEGRRVMPEDLLFVKGQ